MAANESSLPATCPWNSRGARGPAEDFVFLCVGKNSSGTPLPRWGRGEDWLPVFSFQLPRGGRILVAARPAHQVPTRGLTIDSIWSCSRPFDARIVLFRNGSGFPLQSVTRPPASVTSNCPAAKSHGDN